MYFAVLHRRMGSLTAGAGVVDDAVGFIGAKIPITQKIFATAEYLSGDTGSALVSATYEFSKSLSVAAWYQDLNDSPVEQIRLDLVYQGQF